MLIECKECGGKISDKAISCPHCGCPTVLNGRGITNKTHKYRRLGNGYGQIKKLSGNRRKPYVAYPPTKEYKDNGVAVNRSALGYFETYQDALNCLAEYNNSPYDVDARKITFAQVYDLFFADKYVNDKKKTYSKSSINAVTSAYAHLKPLHKTQIRDIKTSDLQEIVDNCPLKHASLEHLVFLIKSVFRYALQHDYIEKDYSQFVRIKIADNDEKGIPFTENEIKVLWDNQNDYAVQITLIMIYSGFRISELETVKIDKKQGVFQGGLKTRAGKNRIVPIHSRIMPFVNMLSKSLFNADKYRLKEFYPMLDKLGLTKANNGTKHTPHDCRHTFSWLADKYGVDSLSKHLLMGHSLGGDVETSVYGHRTIDELKIEIEKIQ